MLSRDVEPEDKAADVSGSEEGSGVFGVACGDAAPALQVQECVFNTVAQLVEFLIVFTLHFPIFIRRNHRSHPLFSGLIENGVAVVSAICQQVFGGDAFDQAASLRAICCGTLRNNDSDRHTMCIHGQM